MIQCQDSVKAENQCRGQMCTSVNLRLLHVVQSLCTWETANGRACVCLAEFDHTKHILYDHLEDAARIHVF